MARNVSKHAEVGALNCHLRSISSRSREIALRIQNQAFCHSFLRSKSPPFFVVKFTTQKMRHYANF